MLTVIISTLASRLDELVATIKMGLSEIDPQVYFLICSQRENIETEVVICNRIKVIKTQEVGLSRSRNKLLNKADTDWVWIQDDDVKFEYRDFDKLVNKLRNDNANDLILIKIKSLEDKNKYYKDYCFHKSHRLLNSLKVSSIELVVRRSFVITNSIYFDTFLGLGTPFPCGEENKFTLNLFQNNARVNYSNIAPCYHTTLLENRNIDHRGRFLARGRLLQAFPFYLSLPLLLKWGLIPANFSFLNKVTLMLSTYRKNP